MKIKTAVKAGKAGFKDGKLKLSFGAGAGLGS